MLTLKPMATASLELLSTHSFAEHDCVTIRLEKHTAPCPSHESRVARHSIVFAVLGVRFTDSLQHGRHPKVNGNISQPAIAKKCQSARYVVRI